MMPRTSRAAPGNMVFHIINRGVGRQRLFDKSADYIAFEEVLDETLGKVPMRICNYCIMPNHWHFVFWPKQDGDLAGRKRGHSTLLGEKEKGTGPNGTAACGVKSYGDADDEQFPA